MHYCTFRTLMEDCTEEISCKWKKIAVALGFSNALVEYIDQRFAENERCLSEVLSKWLDRVDDTGERPRELQSFYDVLEDLSEHDHQNLEAVQLTEDITKDSDFDTLVASRYNIIMHCQCLDVNFNFLCKCNYIVYIFFMIQKSRDFLFTITL